MTIYIFKYDVMYRGKIGATLIWPKSYGVYESAVPILNVTA